MKRIVFPALLLTALTGCMKEAALPTPQLPAATQTGQQTAGCRVDGQLWVPAGGGLFAPNPISVTLRRDGTRRHLSVLLDRNPATDDGLPNPNTLIQLYVPNVSGPGVFALDQPADPRLTNSNPAYAAFWYTAPSPDQLLITGPTATGQLTITRLDTVARVVAGTFQFRSREQAGPATVHVTDGRFDLTY
ncbi:lipoprotein [Hymenobacter endophyticus]|uniref:Lipoprotein n=1 Tax=Hymenobacter endophyticus TaxID=3076335 RepID=A0ABU3TKU5_9BACT|nr:lipoprotein [Hymenobacter endophyticus]MDU0371988.1 lipoprotein [Hymenobacter endophyticus]